MNKRISFVLLSTAVVLVSTLLAYFFSGGLLVLALTVFEPGGRGLPEVVASLVVGSGTFAGFALGIIWARAMAR